MESPTRYVMDAMNTNILDPRIRRYEGDNLRERVMEFKRLLNLNKTKFELFHGHLNAMYKELENYLSLNFKRLISYYNREYEKFRLKTIDNQNQLMRMAAEFDAELLNLDNLSVSGSINSLTESLNKVGISKKRPSKRRRYS
tara:strand:+ start:188 stop:613 length:426 start_codon:yes stop_codon:yes gene_type:complete